MPMAVTYVRVCVKGEGEGGPLARIQLTLFLRAHRPACKRSEGAEWGKI
jgi:hypothetical protein